MASLKLQPPSFISSKKTYDAYKKELKVWSIASSVEKEKQALVVALSLPDDHDSHIKEKIFSEIDIDVLNSDAGMEKLIAFLDKRFALDNFVVAYDKYVAWTNLTRNANQKVEDFISDYECACNDAERYGMKDFEVIKAFKLLDASCLTSVEKQLVFTGIDFEVAKKDGNLFEQMKISIKKFKGVQSKLFQSPVGAEKIDAAFLSEHEEVLASHGIRKVKSSQKGTRKTNPVNSYGEPYTCFSCGSIYHFINKCPQKDKKKDKSSVDQEEFTLFSLPANNHESCLFVGETAGKALLDCACTSTVAGKV